MIRLLVLAFVSIASGRAALAGELVVYHSWSDAEAQVFLDAFTAETGIRARGMRRSTRHLVKIIVAERDRPVASVIMTGPAPSYEMLKAAGLLQTYRPRGSDEIPAEFRDPEGAWTGIYLGVIAFVSDTRKVDRVPRSFEDLLRIEPSIGVVYANPATSGTAYTFLLGLIALHGEQGAFEYLGRLNSRVVEYPSGGPMAVRLVELGEAAVAVAFAHDIERACRRDENLLMSFPAEGTGWEVGAAGLLRGAPEPAAGKLFLDFLVHPATQEMIHGQGRTPIHPLHHLAGSPKGIPHQSTVRRLPVDFVEAGKRWDERALRWNRRFPRGR